MDEYKYEPSKKEGTKTVTPITEPRTVKEAVINKVSKDQKRRRETIEKIVHEERSLIPAGTFDFLIDAILVVAVFVMAVMVFNHVNERVATAVATTGTAAAAALIPLLSTMESVGPFFPAAIIVPMICLFYMMGISVRSGMIITLILLGLLLVI